jgi:hypothetical protein
MADPQAAAPPPARVVLGLPRDHRVARACLGVVGAVLLLLGAFSAFPALAPNGIFLGIFLAGGSLVVVRLVAGALLLASAFARNYAWVSVLAVVLALFFGFLGLAGGVSQGNPLGLFHVSAVDSSLNVLLCTVLLGIWALSSDVCAS